MLFSRTARFGTALVRNQPLGTLNLKSAAYQFDYRPIEEDCNCMVCKNYTRAYLHTVVSCGLCFWTDLHFHSVNLQNKKI